MEEKEWLLQAIIKMLKHTKPPIGKYLQLVSPCQHPPIELIAIFNKKLASRTSEWSFWIYLSLFVLMIVPSMEFLSNDFLSQTLINAYRYNIVWKWTYIWKWTHPYVFKKNLDLTTWLWFYQIMEKKNILIIISFLNYFLELVQVGL